MAAQARPAAGGVVWRTDGTADGTDGTDGTGAGGVRVAVVHRARYDDWSLPKGKLDRTPTGREFALAAAVREVGEEAGAEVAVQRRLRDIRYATPAGRKTVSFWAMRWTGDRAPVGDEVDATEWLPIDAARRRLTYALDREVLDDFAARPLPDSVVVLVRHAKAGKRSEWRGDDDQRPLDLVGEQQALRLVTFLRLFAPDRVVAAEPVRCMQTVQPLAEELGLPVSPDASFGDRAWEADADAVHRHAHALAQAGDVTVVSSQGTAIPGLISRFAPEVPSTSTRKGAVWVLTFAGGVVLSADYYADPTGMRG